MHIIILVCNIITEVGWEEVMQPITVCVDLQHAFCVQVIFAPSLQTL